MSMRETRPTTSEPGCAAWRLYTKTRPILGAAQVGCLTATGILAGFSLVFFFGAVGGNTAWLMAMAKTVRRSRLDVCGWWFAWGGLLVSGTTLLALFAEYYVHRL
ncbi:hypothetical protein F4680DRAFT_447631 [Xylaria scruposa]|nr:hypothetical protein F4680DRAFT_447631 [Xylaria scruposa]